MTRADADREYRRWRNEHARNPETESTPRSAAADVAGEKLLERKIGRAALDKVKEQSPRLALNLTRRSETLQTFGEILLGTIDMDEIPSRTELHQQLLEDGVAEPGELVPEKVAARRRELMLEQVGKADITAIAVTLCEGDRSYHWDGVSVEAIIEEFADNDRQMENEQTVPPA